MKSKEHSNLMRCAVLLPVLGHIPNYPLKSKIDSSATMGDE